MNDHEKHYAMGINYLIMPRPQKFTVPFHGDDKTFSNSWQQHHMVFTTEPLTEFNRGRDAPTFREPLRLPTEL